MDFYDWSRKEDAAQLLDVPNRLTVRSGFQRTRIPWHMEYSQFERAGIR